MVDIYRQFEAAEDRSNIEPEAAVFPGSAEVAHLAPGNMLEQRLMAAALLDVRQALPRVDIIQRLTEPFAEHYSDDNLDVREAYNEARGVHAGFRRVVRHAIGMVQAEYPGVQLEPTRLKTIRSGVAKGILKLAAGDTNAIIDWHGARVVTRGIDPNLLVATLHERGRLPRTLPGGTAAVQVTGSDLNSLMYRSGRRGHKLAFAFREGTPVELGEILAYDYRDLKWYDRTRAGYELERYKRLELVIGTSAMRALDGYYSETVDLWK